MKQLTVHLDAMILIALIFLASPGMPVMQFLISSELMQNYDDSE